MRIFSVAALVLVLVGVTAPAVALEKTQSSFDGYNGRDWQTAYTVNVSYYNICTGWVWVWSRWEPNERVGVTYEGSYYYRGTLRSNWWFFNPGAPGGYGFTGKVEVHRADPTTLCPIGEPFASQPFLPVTGWNVVGWGSGVITGRDPFVVSYVLGETPDSPVALYSDHPARGPTGPQACGSCYPATRTTRSFYFGTESSPLCPGSVLNDGVCDVQFVQDAQACCYNPVSVELESWSSVKAMYR